MYNPHSWLAEHPEARKAVREAVIESALSLVGMCSLLWDACESETDFSDSFTIRRMAEAEANFRHRFAVRYEGDQDRILADFQSRLPETFVIGPKADFKGLAIETSSNALFIWWGYETSAPVIHIRRWGDGVASDEYDYRDHPLQYRDGRDRGYVLTMARGMVVGVNNARAILPTNSGWALDHLPDIRGEVRFEIEHALNKLDLGPVPSEDDLFPRKDT